MYTGRFGALFHVECQKSRQEIEKFPVFVYCQIMSWTNIPDYGYCNSDISSALLNKANRIENYRGGYFMSFTDYEGRTEYILYVLTTENVVKIVLTEDDDQISGPDCTVYTFSEYMEMDCDGPVLPDGYTDQETDYETD